jgi:aminopeptidase YwaD
MNREQLTANALSYLEQLCHTIPERGVGSQGNRLATRFFAERLAAFGWQPEISRFEAIDWETLGAGLQVESRDFAVRSSPYSLGCEVQAPLVGVSSLAELEKTNIEGKIALLYGEIAKEQLMPKNFVFYNPEEHQQIISLLEKKHPQAIVCATGRNPAVAGGVYPFPLIEDGDFDIPSVYMTEEEGKRLLPYLGKMAILVSRARRIPSTGENVSGRKGKNPARRLVFTAHIDAKKGTPGAIDNATGVIVLLLLAELLQNYSGDTTLELVAFNGEDYYAVPGQMLYLRQNQGRFHEIFLNINIDGAGYLIGNSVFSPMNLPAEMEEKITKILAGFPGISLGAPWYQGDHSIFLQFGIPAMAITSQWFLENMDTQDVTHTSRDNPEIVDVRKLVEIALALQKIVLDERTWT